MPTRLLRAAAGAALVLLFALGGCRVVHSSRHTQLEGTPVSQETLNQIRPGDSPELVLALLGEPNSRTPAGEGRELWKWKYRETTTSSGGVLLLLSSSSTTERAGTVFVLFANERVERTWRDATD